jgi:hypothetical protein
MRDSLLLDQYRTLAEGTTVDSNTLLSTDYFNHFNEVVMLLSMLSDMPDMLEEIQAWRPKTYQRHFADSGLAVAPLAIACYDHVPPEYLLPFEQTIEEMNTTIAVAVEELDAAKDDADRLNLLAADYWRQLQDLIDRAGAIVHGATPESSLDQNAIDDMF